MRSIPTINTARLTLRAMRPEDFDTFASFWADPRLVQHVTGKPLDRAEAWNRFLRNAGHWQMTGIGHWAVIERGSAEMIGQVGFAYSGSKMGDDFDPFPQAGWLLATHAQRKGFAREAVVAAHDWFDRVTRGPSVALITEANTASLQLADRMNYRSMRAISEAEARLVLLRRDGPGNAH